MTKKKDVGTSHRSTNDRKILCFKWANINKLIKKVLLLLNCFYFNYVYGFLLVCVYMYCVHAVLKEARRWHQPFWSWSYRGLPATVWVLGMHPGPLHF